MELRKKEGVRHYPKKGTGYKCAEVKVQMPSEARKVNERNRVGMKKQEIAGSVANWKVS